MSKPKMQRCFNCGAELGVYENYYGDIEACGERECQRAMNDAYREREEGVREAAESDDYSRYR